MSARERIPGFHSWDGMMKRCYQPGDKAYHNYGGRGIRVCERWHKFDAFLLDMGVRPEGMTLDRIDVNSDYSPENCRWATIDTQKANMRHNHFIEVFGERMTVGQAAKKYSIDKQVLFSRLRTGRCPDEAVMSPVLPRRGGKVSCVR